MNYLAEKEQIVNLFNNCPFTIDGLKLIEDHTSRLWAKFRHIENVASLMESSGDIAGLSEKEKLMAFTIGQFHDIACINDIALTGKEYGPKHGARGAVITFGLLLEFYKGFDRSEAKIIATAIANHDGKNSDPNLTGLTGILTSMLRDCDKIDCYRRQSTEPLENVFQRPLRFNANIRPEFANRCLSGEPIDYAEMQNFNEEALLYLGWFFQLKNSACKKMAMPLFESLAKRVLNTTEDSVTKLYVDKFLDKAKSTN